MRKFREIMERRIEQVEKGSAKVVINEEAQVTEKAEYDVNPIEELRIKGHILKTNVPTKTGRELTFFKANQAEDAYEYLVDAGYEKKFKIGYAGKTITISNQR